MIKILSSPKPKPNSNPVNAGNSGSYGNGGGGGAGAGMPDMQGMMQQYMGMANQMANFRAQQDERQMSIAAKYRGAEANRDAANQMRLQGQQLGSQERVSGNQLRSQERISGSQLASQERMSGSQLASQERISGGQLASQERMQANDLALNRDRMNAENARASGLDQYNQAFDRDKFGWAKTMDEANLAMQERSSTRNFDAQVGQINANKEMGYAGIAKERAMQTENLGHQKWSQESSQGHQGRMQAEQLANQRVMQTEREGGQDRRLGMNINNQQTMQSRGFEHQVNMTNINERNRQGKVNDDRSAAQAMFRSSGGAGRGALARR